MAKLSNVGAPLTDEEESWINAALANLKAHVAAIDESIQPDELTQLIFKTNDKAYDVKRAIDRAFKEANLRKWYSEKRTVLPFKRAVSPLSGIATPEQEAKLRAVGITNKEELNAELIALGLMPK